MNLNPRVLLPLAALGTLLAGAAQTTSPLTTKSAAPREATAATGVDVRLTLQNTSATPVEIMAGRSNSQQCAFPPHVRVLRVGTREVVYPVGEPAICTQELRTDTVAANGTLELTRKLNLPAGEYMVEVWWKGFVNDAQVFLPAEPVRVTVK